MFPGFPYWPAKGMTVSNTGMVDVRFFGAHDRAWVPARDCFLFCEKDPNNFRSKRQDILDSMQVTSERFHSDIIHVVYMRSLFLRYSTIENILKISLA